MGQRCYPGYPISDRKTDSISTPILEEPWLNPNLMPETAPLQWSQTRRKIQTWLISMRESDNKDPLITRLHFSSWLWKYWFMSQFTQAAKQSRGKHRGLSGLLAEMIPDYKGQLKRAQHEAFLLLVNKKSYKPKQTLNKYSLETLNVKFYY